MHSAALGEPPPPQPRRGHFRQRSRPPEDCAVSYPGGRGAVTSVDALGIGGLCARLLRRPRRDTSGDALGLQRTVRSAALGGRGAARSRSARFSLRFLKEGSPARGPGPSLAIVPVISTPTFLPAPKGLPGSPTRCQSPFRRSCPLSDLGSIASSQVQGGGLGGRSGFDGRADCGMSG